MVEPRSDQSARRAITRDPTIEPRFNIATATTAVAAVCQAVPVRDDRYPVDQKIRHQQAQKESRPEQVRARGPASRQQTGKPRSRLGIRPTGGCAVPALEAPQAGENPCNGLVPTLARQKSCGLGQQHQEERQQRQRQRAAHNEDTLPTECRDEFCRGESAEHGRPKESHKT